jgi:hypothetical protein
MTKGKGIGIFVAVIAVSIVIGIASLPDEVLLESPQLDASENLLSEMIPIVVEEEPIEVVEEPESPDESEGKVITVKINDGVGAKMR